MKVSNEGIFRNLMKLHLFFSGRLKHDSLIGADNDDCSSEAGFLDSNWTKFARKLTRDGME